MITKIWDMLPGRHTIPFGAARRRGPRSHGDWTQLIGAWVNVMMIRSGQSRKSAEAGKLPGRVTKDLVRGEIGTCGHGRRRVNRVHGGRRFRLPRLGRRACAPTSLVLGGGVPVRDSACPPQNIILSRARFCPAPIPQRRCPASIWELPSCPIHHGRRFA